MLKVTLGLFALISLFCGIHGLTCLCAEEDPCKELSCQSGEVCFAAIIRKKNDNGTREEKGCKAKGECNDVDYCPRRNAEICAKYGCCNYDRCVANYTLGVDFDMPSSSSAPSPSTELSMVKSSTPLLEPSSTVVPIAGLPENPATSSVKAKISPQTAIASSAPEAKITSEIPAASSFMTKITSAPMTSVQPEMQSTEGKEVLMPTSEQEMKRPLTASGGVFNSQALEEAEDETCPNGSRRLLSMGTLLVVAVGLLCSIF